MTTRFYPASRRDFSSDVRAVRSAEADAVVVLGFAESSFVLRALVDAGLGPGQLRVYGCDGNMGNALGIAFESGT